MPLLATAVIGLVSTAIVQELPKPICNKNADICYEQLSVKPRLYIFVPGAPSHGIKIEGSVTIMFDVTEKGTVTNMKVLSSHPKGVFERSTLKMLLKNKYYPEAIQGVKARYVYKADK